jgi:hypothetical protein
MAIYVESLSFPTAGGGVKAFISTERWELVTTGVDDFQEPVAERKSLASILKEWLSGPDDNPYDAPALVDVLLSEIREDKIPVRLRRLVQKVLREEERRRRQ